MTTILERSVRTVLTSILVLASVALLLPTALLAQASIPAAGPGPADGLPLWPLAKGLRWTLESVDPWGKNSTTTLVEGTTLFNNLVCYELKSHDGPPTTLEQDRTYVIVQTDGWYIAGTKTFVGPRRDKEIMTVYDPPLCVLKPRSASALTWEGKYTTVVTYEGKTEDRTIETFTFHQFASSVKLGDKEVEATLVVSENTSSRFATFLNPATPNSGCSKRHKWYTASQGIIREEIYSRSTRNEAWKAPFRTYSVKDSAAGPSLRFGSVVFTDENIEKEAASELVEAAPGVVTEFTRSRTIKRDLIYSTKLDLGAEIETKLAGDLLIAKADLITRVKAGIEAERGEKLSDEETRTQTVRIDGDKLPRAQVLWIDVYRAGSIELTHDGKPVKVPFQFPIGTRLVVRKPPQ